MCGYPNHIAKPKIARLAAMSVIPMPKKAPGITSLVDVIERAMRTNAPTKRGSMTGAVAAAAKMAHAIQNPIEQLHV
jgi:hypothetical protein